MNPIQFFPRNTQRPLSYLYRPADTEHAPTIMFLHGAGSRGTDFSQLKNNPFLFAPLAHRFHVYAPLCHMDSWFDLSEHLQDFTRFVSAAPDTDPDRLIVMGNSMGGYATWQLAMCMPQYFCAAVPICGGGMYWNAARLKNVPVRAFHGAKDRVVFPTESLKMAEALRRAGGDVTLTIYPDAAHDSWTAAYADHDLFDYLYHVRRHGAPPPDADKTDPLLYG